MVQNDDNNKEEEEEKREKNEIFGYEYETTVRSFGTSSHIILPRNLAGKRVHVTIKEVDE